MDKELFKKVKQWVQDNEEDYRIDADDNEELKVYLIDDAISEFASWEDYDEEIRDEIGEVVRRTVDANWDGYEFPEFLN